MKQLFLDLLTLLLFGPLVLHAQLTGEQSTNTILEQERVSVQRNQWFIAIAGGVSFQTALPNYSVSSSRLTSSSAGETSPFILGKFGLRFKNKHQVAVLLEKTVASNSFTFVGDYQEGLGVNRGVDYVLVNLEYGYNLLYSKRFWFGPNLQIGLGIGSDGSSAFYDQGREQYFTTPQGMSYHKYDIVRSEIPSNIFNYGIGVNFGVEVIEDLFFISTDLRWLQSFSAVHEYEINYEYKNDYLNVSSENLNFSVETPLQNVHLGLQLFFLIH